MVRRASALNGCGQKIPSEKSSVSAAAKLNTRENSGCFPELTGQLLTVNLPPAANPKVSDTNAVDPKRKSSNENQQMTSNKSSTQSSTTKNSARLGCFKEIKSWRGQCNFFI